MNTNTARRAFIYTATLGAAAKVASASAEVQPAHEAKAAATSQNHLAAFHTLFVACY